MKIVSLSTYGYPSAQRRYLCIFTHEQAKALKKLGVSVEVVDLAPNPNEFPSNTIDEYEGIKVHRVHPIKLTHPLKAWKSINYLKKNIKKGQFDISLCSFLDSKYLKHIPWVISPSGKLCFTIHGRDAMTPHGSIKKFIKKLMKRKLFSLSSLNFTVSEYTETLLSGLIHRKDSDTGKIKVIYNGINFQKFEEVSSEQKEQYRKEFNLPQENFIVISVCQLIKRKGVSLVVDGVIQALKQNKNITHVIVGEGPEKELIKDKIKNSKLEDHFIFLSNLSDQELAKYYIASDLYAMISKTLWDIRATEGFGISYIEASYAGLPVLCGKDGGGTLAVQNNFTGYWIDPNDKNCTQQVCSKILGLMSDPLEYQRISQNGKIYAKRWSSWEQNAQTMLNYMGEL